MALGARLKQARQHLRIGQVELCAKIDGLTQQTISMLERRDSTTSEYAVQLADALGVSVRWLLNGEGDMLSDWPFPDIDQTRFYKLSQNARIEIQGLVRERIEKFEQQPNPTIRLIAQK